ncbi:MAG: hypothetical protein CO128_09705 [Ignavibacteriales bacterium CG_4_9_14_3_um_filter_30_11]|nr:MAG: hypothetical protein CO128_09705 [Ignavibacteriales bacterium CG_4_9_14_3_um_filter_30_11]
MPIEFFLTLNIYDVTGREVKILVSEFKSVGSYSVDFNASNLTSGIYFYRLTSENFTQVKKLVFMK